MRNYGHACFAWPILEVSDVSLHEWFVFKPFSTNSTSNFGSFAVLGARFGYQHLRDTRVTSRDKCLELQSLELSFVFILNINLTSLEMSRVTLRDNCVTSRDNHDTC